MTGATESITQRATRIPPLVILSNIVTTTLLALIATGDNFGAKFGPIDDHEPLTWMGSDRQLSISEFGPTLLQHTEIGDFGSARRFRPGYYVVRVMQTVIFGDHSRWWYLSVMSMYVATAVLLGLAFYVSVRHIVENSGRRMSLITHCTVACVASATALGLPAWQGIATRLGPSEQLGLLSVSIALFAVTLATDRDSSWWWFVAGAAAGFAAFAKESFVPLALAFSVLGLMGWRRSHNRRRLLASAVPAASVAIVVAGVLPALLESGQDVYGRTVSAGRLGSAITLATAPEVCPALLATLAVTLAALLLFRLSPVTFLEHRFKLLAGLGLAVGVIAADGWVNNGNYDIARYRAVVDLVAWVLAAVSILVIVRCALPSTAPPARTRELWISSLCGSFIALSMVVWSAFGFADISRASEANRHASEAFEKSVSAAVSELNRQPEAAFVAAVANAYDYEPSIALVGEVVRRTGRKAFLVIEGASSEGLLAPLEQLSLSGDSSIGLLPIADLGEQLDVICGWINFDPSAGSSCASRGVLVVAIRM